jgi:hydrogenase/urease accessory protein HupE
MKRTGYKFTFVALMLMIPSLSAHEVRPSYLHLKQIVSDSIGPLNSDLFDVVWKQPIANDKRLRLEPNFPEQCHVQAKPRPQKFKSISSDAIVRHWRIACSSNAFENQPITILGLSSTLTDILLVAELSNGTTITHLIRPSNPVVWIDYQSNTLFGDYFRLGFAHFLSGLDHILFIFVLVILIRNFKTLLKTITAFTVAHSLTLAASVLGWFHLPQAPIEASIALSVLFLAYRTSLSIKSEQGKSDTPWVSAFVFGLLHGFGFSTALTNLGLPDDNIISALLLFNLGVESGQILVIGLVSFCVVAISRLRFSFPLWLKQAPIYTIGTISCYWFLQRSILIL